MLKYHTTGQAVVLIDVKDEDGEENRRAGNDLVRPMHRPDGQYFRVTLMTEPFSQYIVPVTSFGLRAAAVGREWQSSSRRSISSRCAEGEATSDADAPAGGGRGGFQQPATDTGKRNIQWNLVGQGLAYYETVFSADGGAPRGGANAGGARLRVPVAAVVAHAPEQHRRAGRGAAPARPAPTMREVFMSWVAPYGPGDTKELYAWKRLAHQRRIQRAGRQDDVCELQLARSPRFASSADPSKRYSLGRGVTTGGGGGRGAVWRRGGWCVRQVTSPRPAARSRRSAVRTVRRS